MGSSIGNVLYKRNPAEPPEFAIIKKFVQDQCGFSPTLSIHPKTIIVTAPSAAQAGQLRFKLHQLQELLGRERRLVIRING